MSFCSDKDLRKGAGVRQTKKVSATINSSTEVKKDETQKSENVVERARLQRELRAKGREERAFCVKIQSWWRGRSSASKITAQLRNEFDRKLSDILNLSDILLNKNKIVFIPPAPICIELARKLTVFGFHGREVASYLSNYSYGHFRSFVKSPVHFCRHNMLGDNRKRHIMNMRLFRIQEGSSSSAAVR